MELLTVHFCEHRSSFFSEVDEKKKKVPLTCTLLPKIFWPKYLSYIWLQLPSKALRGVQYLAHLCSIS